MNAWAEQSDDKNSYNHRQQHRSNQAAGGLKTTRTILSKNYTTPLVIVIHQQLQFWVFYPYHAISAVGGKKRLTDNIV